MNSKFVLQPGKVCTFDPHNTLNEDRRGPILVEILQELKTTFFQPKAFLVQSLNDSGERIGSPFKVSEELLYPDGMTIIRNPSNIPVVNRMDYNAVHNAIDYLGNLFDKENDTITRNSISYCITRLKALEEKFNFYLKDDMEV